MNTIALLSAKDFTLGEGALYALIGFIIVLSVLALLVGIFYLSGFIFRSKLFNNDKVKKGGDKTAPQATSQSDEDEEVVAAITAAIACIYSSESETGEAPEFVIRRIKRNKK